MSGHTQGSWKATKLPDGRLVIEAPHPDLGSIIIAEIKFVAADPYANARLIAANPDLLEVCQAIEAHCRVETTRGNPIAHAAEGKRLREQMRAAILKATTPPSDG